MDKLRLLIVDDDTDFTDELAELLEHTDDNNIVFKANLPIEGLEIVEKEEVDIAIIDLNMPQMSGLELLKKIKEDRPDIEVIMITGLGDMDSVVQAMRLGAIDYFTKPFKQIELHTAIERTRKYKSIQNQLEKVQNQYRVLSSELNKRIGTEIIGESMQTHQLIEIMNKVAAADDTSVLITGESGTGKELVARGIHFLSKRKDNYFHSVNCSAIPESLFESEFFGYNKGAFTGANAQKTGWFEISNQGTLFLDEIGDLRLDLQAKFLRVLDEKIITRVGSHKRIDLDVRIIAATNQDLEELVGQNKFREDLYHRLNSFNIHIPPLRERKEDIMALSRYFIFHYADKLKKPIKKIDDSVFDYLKSGPFHGNVRQLKNLIERAVIMCDDSCFSLKHFNGFSSKLQHEALNNHAENSDLDLTALESKAIKKALNITQHNKSQAAKLLKISRQALDRKLNKYEIP